MAHDNMAIRPYGHGVVLIDLPGGHTLHIDVSGEEHEGVHIHLHDHFNLEIMGRHKGVPLVVIDSDEYPTRLCVRSTESKWVWAQFKGDKND